MVETITAESYLSLTQTYRARASCMDSMDRYSVWRRGSFEADCVSTLQRDGTLTPQRRNYRLGTQLQVFEEEWFGGEKIAGGHVEFFFDSDDEDFFLGIAIGKAIVLLIGSLIKGRRDKYVYVRIYDILCFS